MDHSTFPNYQRFFLPHLNEGCWCKPVVIRFENCDESVAVHQSGEDVPPIDVLHEAFTDVFNDWGQK